MSKVRDLELAPSGKKRIEWAARRMPVLKTIREDYLHDSPLRCIRVAACLHVTTETANLIITLKELGAKVRLCASNPLSTQDDVAAALVKYYGVEVFAMRGESSQEYYENLRACLEFEPHITMDDGGDLTVLAHEEGFWKSIWGGTEETTTGVKRLRQMEWEGVLKYPIIAVNDSRTKYLFDNRYGTGQSTVDGIMRVTNVLFAGKVVVVAGYGWVGRGVAMRSKGLGARVIVTEIDPIKALEALHDGYDVLPMTEAIKRANIVITATGEPDVVRAEHFKVANDGVILANAGHFNVEINLTDLKSMALEIREVRPNVVEYLLKDGRKVYVLCEGRLVNLCGAEGHPAEVMDLSFSNQALAVLYLKENHDRLKPSVYTLPEAIDESVAERKLTTMGIRIDEPSERQLRRTWKEGT
ncbi:MAG: adenosylhomocysteinase [Thermotogae bacterium]|nr:adenosylhomocysteinase [Thermotogota bacterium]